MNSKKIMPNVELTCVTTGKFKTGFFSVSLLGELTREKASRNALVPYVLRRGCARLPDMESLAAELNELYGANIEPAVRAKGEVHCPGFTASFPDDRFLPGEDGLLEKVMALTGEILLSPLMEGDMLNSAYVESEKEKLADRIRAGLNDKRSYALKRLKEVMCEDENFGTDVLGDVEALGEITAESLTGHYRYMLSSSEIRVFYCGSASIERVEAAVLKAFEKLPRDADIPLSGTQIRVNCLDTKYVTEELDVSQGNLALGFRLGETMYKPDYAAITVFNAVYGGSVTSKLFMNVRERLSLCYYASSAIERHKGVMLVSSGIEFEKYEVAKNEILAQLDNVRNGEVSEQELEGAKNYVVSSIKAITDSQGSLENYYLSQAIDETNIEPEEFAELAGKVSLEQVSEIAKSVILDTVYFLRAKEAAE